MKVMVETSARHVHLSQEDLDTLFGKGYRLTNKKDLSQPGQFACEERVSVIGPKGEMKGVSILGPVRPASQVELSLTDARKIGIAAPIRGIRRYRRHARLQAGWTRGRSRTEGRRDRR